MSEKVEHKPAREHHEPRTERTEQAPEHREERPREERPRVERPRGQIPPDTVFIGKKPLMAYATAVMMHFNSGQNTLTVSRLEDSRLVMRWMLSRLFGAGSSRENSPSKKYESPRKFSEKKETHETSRRSKLS